MSSQQALFAIEHSPGKAKRVGGFIRLQRSCGWRSAWYRVEADGRSALDRHLELTAGATQKLQLEAAQ